jgi:hypothetical protein
MTAIGEIRMLALLFRGKFFPLKQFF